MAWHKTDLEKLIGKDAVNLICKHPISKDKIDIIAQRLDKNVSEDHIKRGGCDADEIGQVLSDWYKYKLEKASSDGVSALETLIAIFNQRTVGLQKLAEELKQEISYCAASDKSIFSRRTIKPKQPSVSRFGGFTVNSSKNVKFRFVAKSWPKEYKNSIVLREPTKGRSVFLWRKGNFACLSLDENVYQIK